MATFIPKPADEYRPQRDAEIERLRVLNPDATVEELTKLVDEQFQFIASPDHQFHERFDRRHMAEYVTVVLLSHSLSEALINAVLAIGLANVGTVDLFSILEKADFKQKWLHGPKSFAPQYKFPVGTALYETVTMLNRQRNSLVHLKIELTVEGKKLLDGTQFERRHYVEELRWLRRFFSLPYDLADFVRQSIKEPFLMLLFDRRPIEIAPAHVSA